MAVDNSTGGEAVYTTDGGANWHTTILNYPPSSVSSKTYYCSGIPGGIGYAVGYSGSVFKTKDYGQTWNNVSVLWPGMFKYLEAVAISDANHVWTGGYDYLYRTRDGGATWDTLYYPSASSLTYLKAFDNNTLYLFTTFGQLFKSSDAGDSWTPIFSWPNISLWDVVATSKRLYACADYEGEITTSDDGGLTWSYPVTPADGTYGNLFDLFFYDDNLGFFAGRDGLIGKTTDGGETWRIIPNSYGFSSNKSYNFIYFKDALNGIAGGTSGILQVSNDGGETWTESSIDTVNTPELLDCIFLDLNTGIISAKSGKVYRTTNGGSTWIEVTDKGSMSMKNVFFSDLQNGWIVASDGYIFKTTDGGETWNQTDQLSNINSGGANPDLYRISFVNPTTAYICGENGSIYQSTDTGASWTQLTAPAATIPWNLQGMVWLDESSGIIVGQDGYILGTRNSGITTPTPLAQEFQLESNYPNPFNPTTSISFAIPGTEKVKLVVYNTLGQKVRTLVSGVVAAGHHAVKWDGRNDFGLMSPSGVYFYKLDAGPYSQVRKMTLLK
ncbi:MAG: YCF48-related protein [Calditrichia bacterium]